MTAKDLWSQKHTELFAVRGRLTFQIGQLHKELAEVDSQLDALDITSELASGLDQVAESALKAVP